MQDVDQSPVSTGGKVEREVYSPPKAIAYGLLISVVLASLVSMLGSIVFAILAEPELGSESRSVAALSDSIVFLIVNVSLYTLIMYYAGSVVKRYAASREVGFGAIVSALTVTIYIFLFMASNTFSEFPVWYNISVFLTIVVALNFGARRRI